MDRIGANTLIKQALMPANVPVATGKGVGPL